MKTTHFFASTTYFFWFFALSFAACIPLKDPVEPETENPNPWKRIETANAERLYRNIFASATELYAITDNQFFRFDRNLALLEKRTLLADRQLFGTPILAHHVFLRISQGDNNRQVLEFHVTKNPTAVRRISVNELTPVTEAFEVDASGRFPAVFSDDGTKCFIFGKQTFPTQKPMVIVLDVILNQTFTDIVAITVSRKSELQGLATDGKIESLRFFGGFCYIATKDGAFRISTEGVVTKFLQHWVLDFFVRSGRIYATAFNGSLTHESINNGASWRQVGFSSTLRYVETVGSQTFTQQNRGFAYEIADSTFTRAYPMHLNQNFPQNRFDIYQGISNFENRYIISVDKELWWIENPRRKP